MNKWEIEHIHDFAIEEGSISATCGEESGNGVEGGFGEDESVEEAVDDISECSGGDESDEDDVYESCVLPEDKLVDIV